MIDRRTYQALSRALLWKTFKEAPSTLRAANPSRLQANKSNAFQTFKLSPAKLTSLTTIGFIPLQHDPDNQQNLMSHSNNSFLTDPSPRVSLIKFLKPFIMHAR